MSRARRILVPLALLLALLGMSAAPAVGAEAWWHLSTSARPTNIWLPQSETQEFPRSPTTTLLYVEKNLVACMGGSQCTTTYSLPDDETAAELQASLEAAYGAAAIEVSESSPGHFLLTSIGPAAGHWVPPLEARWGEGGFSEERAKVLVEGGSGRLVISLTNLGDAPIDGSAAPVLITDQLPEGLAADHVQAFAGLTDHHGPVDCAVEAPDEVACSFEGELPSYEAIEVEVFVRLSAEPAGPAAPGQVSVTGGGAVPLSGSQTVHLGPEETPFGVESYSVGAEEEGGAPDTQAGSHPFQITTDLELNQGPLLPGSRAGSPVVYEHQPAQPRNFRFTLPRGLVGDASELPRCEFADFTFQSNFVNKCPPEAAIGAASVSVIEAKTGFLHMAVPVFNLEPVNGEPARFGFMAAGVPVTLDTRVSGEDGYRVAVHVDNTSQLAELLGSTVTLWGNPAEARHDSARGWNCVFAEPRGPCARPSGLSEAAFLRLPTSCGEPLGFPMEMEPWNTPAGAAISAASFASGPLDGCNREPFAPTIEIQPDTHAAHTPTGLQVHLRVPQLTTALPEGISTSDVRSTTVRLPQGLQLNPAGANGLSACSEEAVGFKRLEASGEAVFDEAPATCPEASKLGTVKITSPLIDEPITGAVYQAAQGQGNPFGSLIALYIVAEAPGAGVAVKLAGKVEPTPEGLVSTFAETPQVPFEEFQLEFFGGPTAPLATSDCGSYETETSIAPWSGSAPASPSSSFAVAEGPGGGACQDPAPLSASFSAGSEIPIAGAYSPFTLRLTRPDGAQPLGAIDTTLPPGMIGRLAGIPYCPEAAIAAAKARSGPGEGALERSQPSCPAASRVASVRVGAGVGPDPLQVTGSAYLAGPYKGAPLSLAIITPAIAGPFDLGAVVVRTALYIDPESARITAKSDPLPTELQGIPLGIRSIWVRLDRERFALNPTSCAPLAVGAIAYSTLGQSVSLTSPFQVGACAALGFNPKLSLSLRGGTKRADDPALHAVLKAKAGQANIARAITLLPRSEQIDQAHINNPCTRVQFAAEECPAKSVLGHASATSPLLDEPLTGPVYFRANGGERELPDIVADLRGQIHVVVVGYVDSVDRQVRTRFAHVPDAPVTRFTIDLFGGNRGLLQNNRDICRRRYRAKVFLTAHNGRRENLRPVVGIRCSKKR